MKDWIVETLVVAGVALVVTGVTFGGYRLYQKYRVRNGSARVQAEPGAYSPQLQDLIAKIKADLGVSDLVS